MDLSKKSSGMSESRRDRQLTTIGWDDGTKTEHLIPKETNCRSCDKPLFSAEFIKLSGFCHPCYGELRYGVPGKIVEYDWLKQVEEARDRRGNNFGLGDTVLYNPKNIPSKKRVTLSEQEGVIVDLHEYEQVREPTMGHSFRSRFFLANVFFNMIGKKYIPTNDLEALTCTGLNINTSQFEGILDNVKFTSDPMEDETLRKVFGDPVSKAIWMSYRLNHLIDPNSYNRLAEISLTISDELKEIGLPRDRVHLWFKNRFYGLISGAMNGLKDEQVKALVPYLVGERVANYHIEQAA